MKSSDPEKFVSLTTKSTDSLLEHIHTLSQEALDHADLSVLTATIGAAALIKNSLYVYLQNVNKTMCPPKGDDKGGSLKVSNLKLIEEPDQPNILFNLVELQTILRNDRSTS